jgi:TatD DNase family protein
MDSVAETKYVYVDTHSHFLDEAGDRADDIVTRAQSAGVYRLLAPAVDVANCQTVLDVAATHSAVFAAIGVHPNSASTADDFGTLLRFAKYAKVKAIGETGLDYYRNHTTPALQRSHLEGHMRLAAEASLPIVLHNREADDDLFAIARSFSPGVRGVLHCFSSSIEFARRFLDLGYYISFAGNLTYPSASALRSVAASVPADRLLVETDSPYLAPVPLRGTRNEPANVVHTVAVLATARSTSVAELTPVLAANALQLFDW